MDRVLVWPGAIAQETDLLSTSRFAYTGLGAALTAMLGTSVLVDGFACVPTSPASLSVQVGQGSIYSTQPIDTTAYSSLPADTVDYIVKQGIQLGTVTTSAMTAPTTAGQSVVWLLQVEFSEADDTPLVLPYWNSTNPATPWLGPGNTSAPSNTVRRNKVVVQLKQGVAAATGSQVTPPADAGYTGLYAITIAYGQTTITAGNIVQLASAPYITTKLSQVPSFVQSGAGVSAIDTGAVNALVAAATPAITTLTNGMEIIVKVKVANTGATTFNYGGTGALAVTKLAGAGITQVALTGGELSANQWVPLVYDAATTSWQLGRVPNNNLADGQCYCSLASGTTALLAPEGGSNLFVNGLQATIPAGGVTATLSSPAASTVYYLYAVATSGAISSVEFSTTGYTIDSLGRKNKTGDTTRRLVGMAKTNASSVVDQVISYFNRKLITVAASCPISTTSTSNVYSANNLNFINWTGQVEIWSSGNNYSQDYAGAQGIMGIYFDGAQLTDGYYFSSPSAGFQTQGTIVVDGQFPAEGVIHKAYMSTRSTTTNTMVTGHTIRAMMLG